MGTLRAVNVGMPKDVRWRGRSVFTGVWKAPVDGPVMVSRLNVAGDGQGDLGGHGGEHRAVFVYQLGSYDHWQRFLGRVEGDVIRGAWELAKGESEPWERDFGLVYRRTR